MSGTGSPVIDPTAWVAAVQEPLDFPGTAHGVPRGTPMREIVRRQCAAHGPTTDWPRGQ